MLFELPFVDSLGCKSCFLDQEGPAVSISDFRPGVFGVRYPVEAISLSSNCSTVTLDACEKCSQTLERRSWENSVRERQETHAYIR